MAYSSQPPVAVSGILKVLSYGAALLGFLAAARFLGIAFSAFFGVCFLAAVRFDYRKRVVIPRSLLNVLAVAVVIVSTLRITMADPVTPLLESLSVLMAMKLLEEKDARDYLQVYTLAIFLLSGSALLTLDIQFLIYLGGLMLLAPLCIVILTFYVQDREMVLSRKEFNILLRRASLMPLVAIPLSALFFVILPRTGAPILGLLSRGGAGVGFTDSIQLGQVASIQENNSVALRVEMEPLNERKLYWRGISLDSFDGISWHRSVFSRATSQAALTGKRIAQTIYLEPYDNLYLFALDKPLSVSFQEASLQGDLTTTLRTPVTRRIRYGVISIVTDIMTNTEGDLSHYVALPRRDLGPIAALAKKVTAGATGEEAAVSIERYLTGKQFRYSMDRLPVTSDPLGTFLFEGRMGNCEYFASAMAVMLRLSGIPARLIGGYRGGTYNKTGGYYLITQNAAHVWVEAYVAPKGWVRFDPTPAVAINGPQHGWFFMFRLFADSLIHYWNSAVITHDFNKQIYFFSYIWETVMNPGIDVNRVKKWLADKFFYGIGFVFLIVMVVVLMFIVNRKKQSSLGRVVVAFDGIMKARGYERGQSEGLEEFIERITDADLREKAFCFVAAFEGHCYGKVSLGSQEVRNLRKLLKEL